MTDPNRIDPLAPPPPRDASPTGAPIIPAEAVRYIAAITGLAGVIAGLPLAGVIILPVALTQGAAVAAALGTFLLSLSPGARRKKK